MTRSQATDYFELLLESDETLEDICERYDIGPLEVLLFLFDNGLIVEPYGSDTDDGKYED